ncbi:MAG: 3-oxoacyl-[acyl-carrier-protein] reductase [Lachnospiraceae bacterium]|nr:3-oxoacyl-[acyl-carrier-protein] reductase [Lachnospiraceae bacterium]
MSKTAIVTGGSRGIGKEICLRLAKDGFNIVTCCTGDASKADATVNACKEFGVDAIAVAADVSNAEDVQKIFDTAKEKFGSYEVLVNNAGITKDNLMLRMTEEDFVKVLDVNLKSAFLTCKVATKDMMRAKYGRIINISSVVGLMGNAGQANYSASKAGLIGMTKSLAKEFGAKGVTVNAVAPGFIETEMTDALPDDVKENYMAQIPRKRLGTGADIAAAVSFLASDDADYITGQVLSVDGGMRM